MPAGYSLTCGAREALSQAFLSCKNTYYVPRRSIEMLSTESKYKGDQDPSYADDGAAKLAQRLALAKNKLVHPSTFQVGDIEASGSPYGSDVSETFCAAKWNVGQEPLYPDDEAVS